METLFCQFRLDLKNIIRIVRVFERIFSNKNKGLSKVSKIENRLSRIHLSEQHFYIWPTKSISPIKDM